MPTPQPSTPTPQPKDTSPTNMTVSGNQIQDLVSGPEIASFEENHEPILKSSAATMPGSSEILVNAKVYSASNPEPNVTQNSQPILRVPQPGTESHACDILVTLVMTI